MCVRPGSASLNTCVSHSPYHTQSSIQTIAGQIGDKEAAVTAFRNTYEKTVGIGYRIDLVSSSPRH